MTEEYKNWIRGIFDRTSPTYGLKNANYFSYFAKNIVDLAEIAPGSHVLDVATGRGAIVRELMRKAGPGSSIVGVDLSPGMIELNAKEIQPNRDIDLTFAVMDAENLAFGEGTFDHLFCGFAVFLFPNAEKAFSEFFRVLKPGGKLFLSTWQKRTDLQQLLFQELKRVGYEGKVAVRNFEEEETLLKILAEIGFDTLALSSDELDQIHPSIEEWMSSLWSHASRGNLEKLTPDQLRQLKENVAESLKPLLKSDGLHERICAHYLQANKPKEKL